MKPVYEFRIFASSQRPGGFDPHPNLIASGMTRWNGEDNKDIHLILEELDDKGLMSLFGDHLDKFISVDIALGKQHCGLGASRPDHTIVLREPVRIFRVA